ncbi:hypothetical protein JCM10207_001164 [Rhodosporidiobolus poonsookiae]
MAPSPLLVPSPNLVPWGTRSPGGTSIKDLLAERSKNSPIPPPSPALSDFSTWDSPAPIHSPTFHFEAHHPFMDEAVSPDPNMSDEVDGTVVFDVLRQENDQPLPPLPSRVATPPVPHSPTSFNDGLSIQSLTITDGFSDCTPSPSPSIGSVRIAQVAKIPGRPSRLSISTSSIVSESVEDAPEDDGPPVWDERALARTSFVERLPQDLAAILQASAEVEQSVEKALPDELPEPPAPVPPKKDETTLPKSASKESNLSGESWRANLDAATQQLAVDPAIKPEVAAMQRLTSILGPKTRIISKAPWDGEAAEEPAPLPSRRSTDALSQRSFASKAKENVKPVKNLRSRSFSVLTARRVNTNDPREQEEALKGLGLGLGVSTGMTGSDSKRSLKSLIKASGVLTESDSFSELPTGTVTPPATVRLSERNPKHSSPAALAFPSRPVPERTDSSSSASSGKIPRSGRVPPPVIFDLVQSSSPLPSPTTANAPKSAPATVTIFPSRQDSVPKSGSKGSLLTNPPPRSHSNTSTPSTPSAASGLLSSPKAVPTSPTSASYFTSIPGSSSSGTASPPGFGHKLISLEEARQQQEAERAVAAARTRESTADSLSKRRGVPTPTAITTSATSSPTPAPAPPVATAPAKVIKPKKSGFLKRMMGGGDKHDRPEMPSAPVPESFRSMSTSDSFRPSMSSSASIPTLSTTTPPSSLSRTTGLKVTESPTAHPGRVSFFPTPVTDPNDRIRKGASPGPAPSLSLRPVSMAFSAGLPFDFLAANSPSSPASTVAPVPVMSTPTLRSPAQLASSPPAVASPQASSFQSSTSTVASSLFDEVAPPSGSTTPMTPGFSSLSLSTGSNSDDKPSAERLAALQDEFSQAKRAWKAQQWELETQVRSLQIELEKQREEVASSLRPVEIGDKCDRCGTVMQAPVAETASGSTSVIQRPRFKGNGGAGTLFGSGIVA